MPNDAMPQTAPPVPMPVASRQTETNPFTTVPGPIDELKQFGHWITSIVNPPPPPAVWLRPPGADGPLMTGKHALTTGVGPQLLMTQPPKLDLLQYRNANLPDILAPLAPKPPQLALRAGAMPTQGDGVGMMWTGAYDPDNSLWIRDRALDAKAQATQDKAVVRSDPGNFPDVRGTWAIPAPGRPRT